MNITLTPEELDRHIEANVMTYTAHILSHMPCICKKKQHKNCPKHLFQSTAKMVFDQRQKVGDRVLHEQSKPLIILP